MEREEGENIVATQIARGHKYYFDLLGHERMVRASRVWHKLWILSRDIKAKQSRCDGQRALSNETIASNMWLCRHEDESPANSWQSTLRSLFVRFHVLDFAKFLHIVLVLNIQDSEIFSSKKHFIHIFRIFLRSAWNFAWFDLQWSHMDAYTFKTFYKLKDNKNLKRELQIF